MTKRTLTLLVCLPVLTLLLIQTVCAQAPSAVGTTAPIDYSRSTATAGVVAPLNHTSDITFTPVATLYLPIVSQNYALCATVPTLLSPAPGATLNTLIPMFRWDSGNDPHATEFNLEASKDATFYTLYGFSSRYDAQGIHEQQLIWNFDPATTYYWRAYLMCDDVQGPYTDVWTFTTGSGGTLLPGPELLSPADGTVLASTTVTLRWSPVAGALQYGMYRKSAGSYTSVWRVSETEITMSGLSPNTTYEWWVKARNDYAWGADSPHRYFTTGPSGSVMTSIGAATQTCRSQRHAAAGQDCLLEETSR